MKCELHIVVGSGEPRVVPLEPGKYTIGRGEESTIQIESKMVSRNHAEIMVEPNEVRFLDCGSANGTELNGVQVSHAQLHDGDRITIGEVLLEFHADPGAASEETAPPTRRRTSSPFGFQDFRTIRKQRSLQTLLMIAFTGSIVLFTAISAFSFRGLLRDHLKREALLRAQTLVKYMAEKNREDIRLGNEFLLDVDSIKREKGVREALIINRKGRIIAPISRLNQSENDPFTTEALSNNTDKAIQPSPLLPNGTQILVHPIRAFNDKKGQYEMLGVAKVVFATEDAISGNTEVNRLLVLLLLASGVLGVGLALLFSRMLTHPLLQLAERIHQWRSGQIPEDILAPYKDWNELYNAVDRAIEDSATGEEEK